MALGGLPEFEDVYTGLIHAGFYNLNPAEMGALQPPQQGDLLAPDGASIASVINELDARAPDTMR